MPALTQSLIYTKQAALIMVPSKTCSMKKMIKGAVCKIVAKTGTAITFKLL